MYMKPALLCVAVVLLASCKPAGSALPNPRQDARDVEVETSFTGELFYLGPNELNNQISLARQGDAKAAMRVAEHFALGENDTAKSIPWLTIAAEAGDIVAMQNIGSSLAALGGRKNCEAALMWFERAKREKSPEEPKEYGIDDSIIRLRASFDECVKRGRSSP